jgi:presenilin-like A22 family membrane protease
MSDPQTLEWLAQGVAVLLGVVVGQLIALAFITVVNAYDLWRGRP